MTPDLALADSLFHGLAERGYDGVGITRDAYGPGEQAAHDLVRATAEALRLEIDIDPAGNLYMTLPGRARALPRLILGSHLDSVIRGGNFDGAAGVLAGLAVVGGMVAAGHVPGRDITVLAVRAEEAGSWFPTSYPGSHAALGRLDPAALALRRPDTGRSLAQHMRALGFDPGWVEAGRARLTPANTAAYVELHIEQGPVLDRAEIPVGIVTGIPGARRLRAGRVLGDYNHSGATPRRYRADAAIALAELAYRVDEYWARLETQGHALVVTFCTLATAPEAGFGKVAGEAGFQLDVRSVSPASIDALFAELHRLVPAIAARRGVRFDLGPETRAAGAAMDPGLQAGLAAAAEALGIPHRVMPSGGGHDPAAFAAAGIPAAMLFVRNENGSHNPLEAMRMEDFAAACAVLSRFAAGFAG